MDKTTLLFAWTLGGGLAFALLGALFGGLSGWLNWRAGYAGGTKLGHRIADALSHLFHQDLSPIQRGALIGAADGGMFLGMLGTILGLIAARFTAEPRDWIVPLFSTTLLLICGTLVFGFLALGMVRLRWSAILGLFAGGMAGAFLTARYVGVSHIVPGAVAGVIVGVLVAALWPRSGL